MALNNQHILRLSDRMFRSILFLLVILPLLGLRISDDEKNKKLFRHYCGSCHRVNSKLVGPALAHIEEKRELKWIIQFSRDGMALVKANDSLAVKVYKEGGLLTHPNLKKEISKRDVKKILAYIKTVEK